MAYRLSHSMVPPGLLLVVLLGLTLTVLLVESFRESRQAEAVRRLAGQWGMGFGRRDTLNLTARVARSFPVPGAAALRVYHIVYGTEGDRYRYIFTAQYTLGVTGPKLRHTRVATFVEPRDRRGEGEPTYTLADEGLPILEQYEELGPVGEMSGESTPVES